MAKNNVRNKANVIAVFGRTGSGKSAWLKQHIEALKPKRIIVWDPMREYGHIGTVYTELAPLVAAISAAKRGRFAVVFQPATNDKQRAAQFDVWCGIAYAAGDALVLVEELKFVTRPSWAPARWSEITLTGRHRGLYVIGVSQRPASIDKDFFGSATLIHTGPLVFPEDIKTVAKAMNIPEAEIDALVPLQFIERNMETKEKITGTVTF